jgi:hypothetical protein
MEQQQDTTSGLTALVDAIGNEFDFTTTQSLLVMVLAELEKITGHLHEVEHHTALLGHISEDTCKILDIHKAPEE